MSRHIGRTATTADLPGAPVRLTSTRPTWRMTRVELARVFAEHFGWTVRGNWIRDERGVAVAVGWDMVADRLAARGWIAEGVGVNWRRAGASPRLPRVTRNARGYWV